MKLIKFSYFQCITFSNFCNNEHQHVAKHVLNFMPKIIINVRTTVYRIAIPLDSKVAISNLSKNQT